MPNISFDFSGHVAAAPIIFVYHPTTKQAIDVREWTSQELADALNAGTVIISLGDYLYCGDSNIINKENYLPAD